MEKNAFIRKYVPHCRLTNAMIKKYLLHRCGRYLMPESDVLRGEADPLYKNELIDRCRKKWEREYLSTKAEAEEKIQTLELRERQAELINDAVFCRFAYGFTADEFFAFDLAGKDVSQRQSYVSDVYRIKMAHYLNDYFLIGVFLDKYQTYLNYKDAFKREAISVSSDSDWEAFSDFYDRHASFILKRVDLARGNSVALIRTGNADEKKALFGRIVKSGKHILEEKIDQGEALSVFHPASVNTIRLVSIWKDGRISIPYCILRTGRGNAVIDNASAGGISAAIDPETGIITTDGMDERNHVYEKHPDSGVAFRGYQIPEWDGLLSFMRDIITKKAGIVYIGWDIAYSRQGWCLVEGNFAPQLEARQVLCGGMKEEFDRIVGRKL